MLQQYVSIADYVMITKLDFSAETTEGEPRQLQFQHALPHCSRALAVATAYVTVSQ